MSERTDAPLFRRMARSMGLCLKAGIVCGVLLHLTVRDAVPVLATVYYGLPRSLLAVLAMSAAVGSLIRRSGPRALFWFAASLAIAAWWHAAEWTVHRGPPSASGLRVMYWNVGRGSAGWEAVMRRIEHEQPDIAAIGEITYPTGEFRALWRGRFPQYDISFLGGEMMCLVRGTSTASQVRYIDGYTQARELDARIGGSEVRCLIVDVYAHPLYDRRQALSMIAQVAEQSADRPLIVMGDFNTPPESVHFRDLRRNHVNAFEGAGDGYAATWPAFAPVLSLDQIWGNQHVEVLECRHGRTSASDHRPVLTAVRNREATPPVHDRRN